MTIILQSPLEAINNLTMPVKTQSCGDLTSGITVTKDKHQNKVQEINDQLRDLCQAKNVNFIDRSKSLKPEQDYNQDCI